MLSFLGFGQEKKSFDKLIRLIKGPSEFFTKNKEDYDSLMYVLTFIVRFSTIISGTIISISAYINEGISLKSILLFLVLAIFIAKLLAGVGLWISPKIYNYLAKKIFKKDNFVGAQRVVAYSSVTMFLRGIPFISWIGELLSAYLYTVGFSKQYKMSYLKSFILYIMPIIIILTLLILVIILTYINRGIFDPLFIYS